MQPLCAGNLTLVFDPKTASLRYLKAGGAEILRGVYAAVRDENWGTVPFTLENMRYEELAGGFSLSFTSVHRQGDVHFVWHGRVEGKENDLEFVFDGEAKTSFRRNRVGFCVLHPMSVAGAACVLKHTDGLAEDARFPERIAPYQPFKNVRAIAHEVAPGVWTEVTLTGDTFETEDQRNWTDASFKTYCTPLAEPFPVAVQAGDRVWQRVTVRLEGTPPEAVDRTKTFTLLDNRKKLPRLGVGTGNTRLSRAVLTRLKDLNLDHLRVDVHLGEDYTEQFRQKLVEATFLGVRLEVALFHTYTEELEAFASAFPKLRVDRFLVFRTGEKSTTAWTLERARRALTPVYPGIPLFGGTDAFFTELNRDPPPADAHDGLVYSLNPQVHAFDDASLMETLPAQTATVENAFYLGEGKPVAVSPITFKMRHNPNATGNADLNLEAQTEPRQHGFYGAAWTLGSLKYLTLSAASSLTYFEAAGPLGLISVDGEPYPLFNVFRELGAWKEAKVIQSHSSHPLQIEGLALSDGNQTRVLLANLTAQPQVVQLQGLVGTSRRTLVDFQKPLKGESSNRVLLEPFEVTVVGGSL